MRIIPAIDIIEGKCVRLEQGDYSKKKVYNEDPLEVAKEFEAHGIQYLHLVDLDGAKAKQVINYKVLERIASGTSLKIDFGGGIKSEEDLKIAFESGAVQITGGSIAAKEPEIFTSWIAKYGPDKIILGADARDGKIAVSGWQEESDLEVLDFISGYQAKGIQYVICTDIAKDGMLEGPSLKLYRDILEKTGQLETTIGPSGVEDQIRPGIALIASGGVSSMQDIRNLKEIGCEGAILGKAIYENRINLKELEQYALGS